MDTTNIPGATVTALYALNIALATIGVLCGWLVKGLHDRVKEHATHIDAVRTDAANLRIHVAERYLSRADHREAIDAVMRTLRRIEDKLDRKADRPGMRGTLPTSDFGEFVDTGPGGLSRRREDMPPL